MHQHGASKGPVGHRQQGESEVALAAFDAGEQFAMDSDFDQAVSTPECAARQHPWLSIATCICGGGW